MIRVLLADGDAERVRWLRPLLESAGLHVVALATSGEEAVRKAGTCKAQVAAIAFELPDFSGAEATRRIMETHPLPVVLVLDPATTESPPDLDGASTGATTVVQSPPPPGAPDHGARLAEVVNALRLMHEIPVVQRRPPRRFSKRTEASATGVPGLIGVAASTGGPAAVQALLQGLPSDFPIPILLVQHMSDGFSSALVEWLDKTTPLRVVPAEDGVTPQPGTVYVAAGQQRHLIVNPGPVLTLEEGEPVQGHCPSATLMLQSLARSLGPRAVGIVLTGMGDDGAEGLLELKRRGGVTLAQDEVSSVVYGMPREAVRRGAVGSQLNPPDLAVALLRLARLEPGPVPVAEQKETPP